MTCPHARAYELVRETHGFSDTTYTGIHHEAEAFLQDTQPGERRIVRALALAGSEVRHERGGPTA